MAGRVDAATRYMELARQLGWEVKKIRNGHRVLPPDGKPPITVHAHSRSSADGDGQALRRSFREAGLFAAEVAARKAQTAVKIRIQGRDRAAADEKAAVIAAGQAAKEAERLAVAAGARRVPAKTLMAPHLVPKTFDRVLMSPDLAAQLMTLNQRDAPVDGNDRLVNRPVASNEARHWDEVVTGRNGKRWRYFHQGVAIDSTGLLLDGQKRLAAIARNDVTVEIMVTVGLDPDTFYAADTGRTRTTSDVLRTMQVPSVAAIGALVKLVFVYTTNPGSPNFTQEKITPDTTALLLREPGFAREQIGDPNFHANILEAGNEGSRLRQGCWMIPAAASAGVYLIRRANPGKSQVEEFLDAVRTGVGLTESDDPRLALRNACIRVHAQKGKRTGQEQLAWMLSAWRKYALREPMAVVSWRKGSGMPEVYTIGGDRPASTSGRRSRGNRD